MGAQGITAGGPAGRVRALDRARRRAGVRLRRRPGVAGRRRVGSAALAADAPSLGDGRQPGDSPAGRERRHGGGVRRGRRAPLAHRARSGGHGCLARRRRRGAMGHRLRATRRHAAVAAHVRADLVRGARRARRTRPDTHHALPGGRGAVGARAGAPGARRRARQPNGAACRALGAAAAVPQLPRIRGRSGAPARKRGCPTTSPSRPPAWSRPSDSAATGRPHRFSSGRRRRSCSSASAGRPAWRVTGSTAPRTRRSRSPTSVTLRAGRHRDLWFRFGQADGNEVGDPAARLRAIAARARGPAAAGVRPACPRGRARGTVARRAADGRARRRRRDRRATRSIRGRPTPT